MKNRFNPYLLILTAGVLWGGTFSLALLATRDGAHPMALTTWQVILTALIFSIICIRQKVPVFNRKNLGKYFVVGVIGIVAPDILYYNAAPHLSAGILSVTVSTVPLFTYLIMWGLGLEGFNVKRALGIILGMIAILLLVLPDHGLSSIDANYWILAVVACALLYACENVYISEGIGNQISIFELLCGSAMVSLVFLIPVTYFMGVGEPVSWIFSTSGLAISGIALVSVIAYSLFFHTIRTAGPVFASQCAYIVTISGVLWGILIFSEQHTIWLWVSVVVMVIGVGLVSPSQENVTNATEE